MDKYYCEDCDETYDSDNYCKHCRSCLTCVGEGCENCHICENEECLICCRDCGDCVDCLETPTKYCKDCHRCSDCYVAHENCCNRCKDCSPYVGDCLNCLSCSLCYKPCKTCKKCLKCNQADSEFTSYCINCIKRCETCSENMTDVCIPCCNQAVKPLHFIGTLLQVPYPTVIEKAVSKQLGLFLDDYKCYLYRGYNFSRKFYDMAIALPKCFQNSRELNEYRLSVMIANLETLETNDLIEKDYVEILSAFINSQNNHVERISGY